VANNICPVCGFNLDSNSSKEVCDACGTSIAMTEVTPAATKPRTGVASQMDVMGPYEIDAINAFEKGKRIITVLGFAGSGKTSFVNRLRNDLAQGPWRRSPQPQKEILLSPEGLDLTLAVPFKQRRGQTLSYVLVDLSGESFMGALSRFQEGRDITVASTRSYLAAMAFASAYILLIRLEDVYEIAMGTNSRNASKVHSLLGYFNDILSSIAIASDRLMHGERAEDFLRRGISKTELNDSFDRKISCEKPICVLFSQADRVGIPKDRDGSGIDPEVFARENIPELYHQIVATFRDFRFDYASAFQGLGVGEKVTYQSPSYGALEAFLWLHGHFDRNLSVPDRLKRLSRRLGPKRVRNKPAPLPDNAAQKPRTWKMWSLSLPSRLDAIPAVAALGLGVTVGGIAAIVLLNRASLTISITVFLLLLGLGVGFALTGEPVLNEAPVSDLEPSGSAFVESQAKTAGDQGPAPTPRSTTKSASPSRI